MNLRHYGATYYQDEDEGIRLLEAATASTLATLDKRSTCHAEDFFDPYGEGRIAPPSRSTQLPENLRLAPFGFDEVGELVGEILLECQQHGRGEQESSSLKAERAGRTDGARPSRAVSSHKFLPMWARAAPRPTRARKRTPRARRRSRAGSHEGPLGVAGAVAVGRRLPHDRPGWCRARRLPGRGSRPCRTAQAALASICARGREAPNLCAPGAYHGPQVVGVVPRSKPPTPTARLRNPRGSRTKGQTSFR